MGARESVGNVDLDLGEINRFVVGVRDGEVGGAGAQAAVDDGDRFGVGGLSQGGGGEHKSQQDRFHQVAIIEAFTTKEHRGAERTIGPRRTRK